MKNFYTKLIFLSLLLSSFNLLQAQVGVYDPSFGNGGKVFQLFSDVDAKPSAVVTQADGKIVVGGSGGDFSIGRFKIVRYNSNGSLDGTFGLGGISTLGFPTSDDVLHSLVMQPDGKIIGGGTIKVFDQVTQQTDADFYIFRLKTNGTLDSSFGTNGIVVTDLIAHSDDILHEVIVKPDGKILAGGQGMDMSNGDNLYGLVQYNDNGTIDNNFGAAGKTVFVLDQQDEGHGSLLLLPSGQIMAGITVVHPTSGFYEWGLVRFNANGTLDTGFGTSGVIQFSLSFFHSILNDIALQSDGKLILVGQTDVNNASALGVVRVDANGAYDPNFGVNGVVRTHISEGQFTPDVANTVTIQRDQKIIVGGTLDNAINSFDANFTVVRYLPNGDLDQNFGRQGIIITDIDGYGDFATAGVQQTDGRYILVGSAESSQTGGTGFGIVRYLSDARYYYNTLKGSVFYDNNGNGIKDAGESFFQNAVVEAQKTGIDTIRITSSSGIFTAETDTGTYTIRPMQPSNHVPYFVATPPSRTIGHSTYFNTDSVSFAMRPIPGMRDIFVYIVPLTPVRPGFPADYMVVYGNNGTDTVPAGTVSFVPSSLVTVTSTVPGTSSVSGDTLRWNYVNLYPRDTAIIIVHTNVLPPPTVNIGDTLVSYASITPTGLDQQPKDNIFILKQVAIGSFDPNDKTESHAGLLTPEQVTAGEYLQYVIRFQNTGTDTAFNIYVRDTLHSNLDWNTMEMVAASHPYKLVMDDGICLWTFNNIALVDSTQNEPESHGYIVFRIKPKATLLPGNMITNNASIYFDYNLPVLTNTETTMIVAAPVPVKLLSFSARKDGKTNLLYWSTTNEVNAERFVIERSANGISFTGIGTVLCIANSSGTSSYDFTDVSPLAERNYYRLKIMDKDGRFEYSPVRLLSNNQSDYFTLYPNPVREVMQVRIESERRAAIQAQVLSFDGKLLQTSVWSVEQGTGTKLINTSSLPAGSYLLKITPLKSTVVQGPVEPIVLKFEKL